LIHLDFETCSAADLKVVGTDVYAKHWTTDVVCMAYAFEDGPIEIWHRELPSPTKLLAAINAGENVLDHNAHFELLIWQHVMVRKYGWPELKPEQTSCTMIMAYAMSLPGALENAAIAVGLDHQKDMKGSRVMLQLSQPRTLEPLTWYKKEEFPEKYEQTYKYCMQDVEVERELAKRLMPISKADRKCWLTDYRINRRGVRVDLDAVKKALEVVAFEKEALNARMREITGNTVAVCSETGQFRKWINDQGVFTESVAKDALLALLKKDIPPQVREAIVLRQEAGKTSVAKLDQMLARADPEDHRVRGLYQFWGANTRRFAGRGVQIHNLPRPRKDVTQDMIEDVFRALKKYSAKDAWGYINACYGAPLEMISDCLRGFFIPTPGKKFVGADLASIEARALPWLAGEEWKLQLFRDGGDPYIVTAASIYNVDVAQVTKKDPRRQVGKVGELSFGYQGGKGAFQMMAKNYDVFVSDDDAERFKKAWRAKHPAIVNYWHAVENAAKCAIMNPAKAFKAGAPGREVVYKMSGTFLLCKLPSNGVLTYPYPKIENLPTKWKDDDGNVVYKDTITYRAWDSVIKKFERVSTYGGSLVENITQSLCTYFLTDGIEAMEEAGIPVAIHVHDEGVGEVDLDDMNAVNLVGEIWRRVPAWAKDFPMGAEPWEGMRYQK
jgi:DNA polymerase